MQWSPQQDKALLAVQNWLKFGDRPIFTLFGFAGTGKSTLAKEIYGMAPQGKVVPMAYTGKAALVMRKKGLPTASTIHSAIYIPNGQDKNSYEQLVAKQKDLQARLLRGEPDVERELHAIEHAIKREVESLNRPSFSLNLEGALKGAALGLLDEMSMVDEFIGADILSFGTKVLAMGDPFQLPPVKGTGYFNTDRPDVMLTEVHRQARDNPIIHLATTIREGGSLRPGQYGSSAVIRQREAGDRLVQMALDADQILVGRNATRRASNLRYRELRGWSDTWLPQAGERLICLRNNHELGLLNGLMFTCTKRGLQEEGRSRFVDLVLQHEDGGDPMVIQAWAGYFRGEDMTRIPHYERRDAQEFDYGHAITVHKSQGSQWDDVLLFNESGAFKGSWRNWLYTGITRAAERVTVVEM
jgi:exodeoxyribonuclease-5